MEQKDIGSFIAALRKSNNMTQKELAQKLNVSDKAVSRWERGESAPDLMLIPVLAENFCITADELLRGEKNRTNATEAKAQTDKRFNFLLNNNLTKLKIRSIISGGIAVIGLIAAVICNSALLRSSLGFLVGCLFYAIAAICEACFAVAAHSAVNSPEFDSEKIAAHKTKLNKIIFGAFAVIAVLFTVTLPLLLGDVYVGIDEADWFGYSLVCLAVLAAVSLFSSWVIRYFMGKKGKIQVSESNRKKTVLKIKTTAMAAILIAASVITHIGIYGAVPLTTWAPCMVHNTVSNFQSYIETPKIDYYNSQLYESQTMTISQDAEDEYCNNYAQEWQALLKQNEVIVYSAYGEELFRYSHLNELVEEIHFSDSDDKLPIYTYTDSDLRKGKNIKNLYIYIPFIVLYFAEAASAFLIYRKKSKQI